MSSPAILYLLSGLLFGASLCLILIADRSSWIRRTFGVERMVEDVLETDFCDDSGEFTRPPSRVSGLFSLSPSGSHGTMQHGAAMAGHASPERNASATWNEPSLSFERVAQHDTTPERSDLPSQAVP